MPKLVVYYSSATSDLSVKKNQTALQFLLEKKKVEFEQIDMAQLDKPTRDGVYEKAGVRTIPMLFVDDKYVGDYEAVQNLEEEERLDSLIK